MGGRAGQTTTGTTTAYLPPGQQDNVDILMHGAKDYYKTGGPQYYPGQTLAGIDPLQTQGRTMATNYATGVGADLVGQAQHGDQYFLNPNNIFNPQNIPGFSAAQQGVTQQVTNNLNRNILPQIRSNASAVGALGGSNQGIGEALAVGETNRALADTLANMNMSAYTQGLNQYNAAQSRVPQNYALGLAPSTTLQGVGEANRADSQAGIDDAVKRYNFDQLRPLLNLQSLQALTGTAGQYGGTTTSTQNQNLSGGGSPWMQGVGSLLTILPSIIGAFNSGGSKTGGVG